MLKLPTMRAILIFPRLIKSGTSLQKRRNESSGHAEYCRRGVKAVREQDDFGCSCRSGIYLRPPLGRRVRLSLYIPERSRRMLRKHEFAGKLIGMNAEEVVPWLLEDNRLKAAIGLATANAIFNLNVESYGHGNVVDEVSIESSDTFGMIGEFRTILAKVRAKAKQVYVFEQKPNLGEGLYSEQQIPELLPRCSVSSSLLHASSTHTIDGILAVLRECETGLSRWDLLRH